MSSTLSEGVRVPDIGSVNWGADVNFNWGLLNTALANISSNVKVNVANTWTATQTFSETISGSIDGVAARAVNDEDGNNIKTALAGKAADNAVVHLAGAETITGDKTFTGAVVTHNIRPLTDGTYNLGTNQLRWTRLYTSENIFIHYKDLTFGTPPTQATYFGLRLNDNTGAVYGDVLAKSDPDGHNALRLRCRNTDGTNTYDRQISLIVQQNGTTQLIPNATSVFDLGRKSAKWKTLNGINPGALSFPDNSAYIDISSSITDRTYGSNSFVAAATGWIAIGSFATAIQIADDTTGMAITGLPGSDGYSSVFLPVRAGDSIRVLINQTSTTFQSFKLLPCLGNV